jgi:hypothetical protein
MTVMSPEWVPPDAKKGGELISPSTRHCESPALGI